MKATLHAIDNRDFICSECIQKNSGRNEQMLQKIREQKGCFGVKSSPIHNINKEIFFSSCIGNYFNQAAVSWLSIHEFFDKGQMPFAGSLLDQPAKIIDVMSLIKSHKIEQAEKRQKQEALKASGRRGRQ